MKRIVCLCEGLPHPHRGASLVLYHSYLQGLLEAGFSVRLLVLPQTKQHAQEKCPDAVELGFAAGAPLEIERIRNFPCVLHTPAGVRVASDAKKATRSAIHSFDPELVLCFDIVAAALARDVSYPRVAWLGDLQFETLFWHTRYAMVEGSRRYDRLFLLPLRMMQLRRFYRHTLSGARIIVSSKSSESKIAALGYEGQYLPYPWPSLSSRRSAKTIASTPTFLFSGTLGALGSRSAFHTLFDEIYPRMMAAFGRDGFAIWITGAGELPTWVSKAVTARTEIRFLGFVDDLGATMDMCTAFIAPIEVPVGNRSRLLTCMAAGLPIIADPSTALGNPLLIDGQTCLLERGPNAFVSAAERLFHEPSLAAQLSDAARQAYVAHHAPKSANAALLGYLSAPTTKD